MLPPALFRTPWVWALAVAVVVASAHEDGVSKEELARVLGEHAANTAFAQVAWARASRNTGQTLVEKDLQLQASILKGSKPRFAPQIRTASRGGEDCSDAFRAGVAFGAKMNGGKKAGAQALGSKKGSKKKMEKRRKKGSNARRIPHPKENAVKKGESRRRSTKKSAVYRKKKCIDGTYTYTVGKGLWREGDNLGKRGRYYALGNKDGNNGGEPTKSNVVKVPALNFAKRPILWRGAKPYKECPISDKENLPFMHDSKLPDMASKDAKNCGAEDKALACKSSACGDKCTTEGSPCYDGEYLNLSQMRKENVRDVTGKKGPPPSWHMISSATTVVIAGVIANVYSKISFAMPYLCPLSVGGQARLFEAECREETRKRKGGKRGQRLGEKAGFWRRRRRGRSFVAGLTHAVKKLHQKAKTTVTRVAKKVKKKVKRVVRKLKTKSRSVAKKVLKQGLRKLGSWAINKGIQYLLGKLPHYVVNAVRELIPPQFGGNCKIARMTGKTWGTKAFRSCLVKAGKELLKEPEVAKQLYRECPKHWRPYLMPECELQKELEHATTVTTHGGSMLNFFGKMFAVWFRRMLHQFTQKMDENLCLAYGTVFNGATRIELSRTWGYNTLELGEGEKGLCTQQGNPRRCKELAMEFLRVTNVAHEAHQLSRGKTKWRKCASERRKDTPEVCRSMGEVRFGAEGKWVTRKVDGDVACSMESFGRDPIPGKPKHCETIQSAYRPLCSIRFVADIQVCNTCCCKDGILKRAVHSTMCPGKHPLCKEPILMHRAYDMTTGKFAQKNPADILKPVTLQPSKHAQCSQLFLLMDGSIRLLVSQQSQLWLNLLHGRRYTRNHISKGNGGQRATGCLRLGH